MKFSIRFADQIVGALVILALVILVFVIFMIGSNQRWFSRDYQYKTFFTSASGINPNMPIQYKGFTIGQVKKISLSEHDRVEVIFNIFDEYAHRVTEGSLVEVQVSPIGLGNSFIFHPGLGTERIPEGNVIPEINSPEARLYISAGLSVIPKANDSISNIVNQVNTLLDTINISLAGSTGADNLTLGQILLDIQDTTAGLPALVDSFTVNLIELIDSLLVLTNNLSEQLNPLLHNLEAVTDRIADPSGAVIKLLDGDGQLYEGIVSSIDSISGIIGDLNRTTEFIPEQLPQVGILINELNTVLRTTQDVLTAVANNPLLRGGIPERKETGPGGASPRNLEF